jgi:hypothetical protein
MNTTPYPGFALGMPALNIRTYTVLETTKDPRRLRQAEAFVAAATPAARAAPPVPAPSVRGLAVARPWSRACGD